MQPSKEGLKVCLRENTLEFATGKGLSVFLGGLVGFPDNFSCNSKKWSSFSRKGYREDWSCMCLVFKGSVISATWLSFPACVVYLQWLFGNAFKTKKSEPERVGPDVSERLLALPEQAVNLLFLQYYTREELIFDRTGLGVGFWGLQGSAD